ncbi:DUF4760 domain-containing protein [Pseudomonas syringae]|uniref:DUF4760 domain-containing protein n=1 Tax=Pseudomonas syringae TaxID=317 RepID=UPI000C06F086|nr:hypothetical protein [Pseudomonas syringae]PHN79927.1 hypothetical protein AO071_05155 [Pseudomonas syringae]
MELVSKYKDLAEFIYYLSGPFMLVGLAIGLLQLRAFKTESETRFKRETIITTLTILEQKIDAIDKFHEIAFGHESFDEMPEETYKHLGFSKSSSQFNPEWLAWYQHENQIDFQNAMTNALNSLEGLASYIFSGVTDEELCYKIDHHRVMYYIKTTQVYWAEARDDDDNHIYEGIHNLYKLWQQRMLHEDGQKELKAAKTKVSASPKPQSQNIYGVKSRD